jgi:hypothetical protein
MVTADEIASVELLADVERDVLERLAFVHQYLREQA